MTAQDELVDKFVRSINRQHRDPLFDDEAPASVRVSGRRSRHDGCTNWRIKHSNEVDWIAPLEDALSVKFPPLYRSLVSRCVFPSFEVRAAKVWLFGNTPEGTDFYELRIRLVDGEMTSALLAAGYLQFGQPGDSGNYDPMCFDLNSISGDNDHPIVRIDHEGILCWNEVEVIDVLYPTLADLMNLAITQSR